MSAEQGSGHSNGSVVIDRVREKQEQRQDMEPPKMFKVVGHNDDFTPMDYVVGILVQHFNKSVDDAITVMLDVHQKGKGVFGVYTHDVAESKQTRVMDDARQSGHPFRTTMEPA